MSVGKSKVQIKVYPTFSIFHFENCYFNMFLSAEKQSRLLQIFVQEQMLVCKIRLDGIKFRDRIKHRIVVLHDLTAIMLKDVTNIINI